MTRTFCAHFHLPSLIIVSFLDFSSAHLLTSLISWPFQCSHLSEMCIGPRTEGPPEPKEDKWRMFKNVLQLQIHFIYAIVFYAQDYLRQLIRKHFCKESWEQGQVRISRIVFKYKMDPEEISRRQDFIPSCGHFVELEALDNPNWHLYCVERERAFFVLLPRHISYYSAARYPFVYVPIFEEALALAEVRKEELIQLGKKFEEEGRAPKTVLFTNTARCGSTLMAKMLDRPGNSICYGEPHALCSLSIGLAEEQFSKTECKQLLEATVSCLRAHTPMDQVCVLKTTSGETKLVPLCEDISNLKHMFMFRSKGLPSVEKVCRREEVLVRLLLAAYNLSPQFGRVLSSITPTFEGHWARKLRPENVRLWSAIVYAAPYSDYLKNKEAYCHPIVWYQELMEDSSKVLEALFNNIDIPLDCVEGALEMKKEDSQKESFLSRNALSHVKIPPMTNEDRKDLERYADAMEIPRDTFDC